MPNVSIVIPVAPYHADMALRAVQSAERQTEPCSVIVVHDTEAKGAGWARNQGLSQVQTPFVVFLDADDWIEPTFIERCLRIWQPNRYVYTDWYVAGARQFAPECAWVNETWHVITTLIPTAYVRRVGGFDETLPGGEDTDLYLRFTTQGFCGLHLPLPLFHYTKDGQRGKAFVEGPEYQRIMKAFTAKYGGKQMTCCGGDGTQLNIPLGDAQPGDVLAAALWQGNRQERGRVSGRLYPRTGNGKQVWVDPRDVHARPDLWREIEAEPEANYPDALAVFGAVFGNGQSDPLAAKAPRAGQPDFGRVLAAGKAAFDG